MDQPFDSDVMDDLAAESPYSSHERDVWTDEFDAGEFEDDDQFDDEPHLDPLDESATAEEDAYFNEEPFGDTFEDELSHEFDEATHQTGVAPSMDAIVAEALSASTLSQFLQRLLQGVRQLAVSRANEPTSRQDRPLRKSLRNSNGKRSRTRSPVAERNGLTRVTHQSTHSNVQAIAPLLNQLLSNRSDDHQAFTQVLDWAETTASINDVASVIAGLALRSTLPQVTQWSQRLRLQLVQAVRLAIADLTRQHSNHAARAIGPILQSVQKVAKQRQLPNRELALAVRRTAHQVSANADLVNRLVHSRQAAFPNPSRSGTVQRIQPDGGVQRLVIEGPVEIIIRSL